MSIPAGLASVCMPTVNLPVFCVTMDVNLPVFCVTMDVNLPVFCVTMDVNLPVFCVIMDVSHVFSHCHHTGSPYKWFYIGSL